ncbi:MULTISPECIES: hypothetical protein [unclassified Yoonia]|uniref:hypothetical protein n=1 Tax=unclassified Yoonia TaxID=2629118 RepID=UPI002AFDE7DB|nr:MULTISPECIES: hypothetical protein [unclassified Yoonia]
MSLHHREIAGDPTASLHQLDDLNACCVIYLRLWCDGPEGRAAVRRDLSNGLGPRRASTAIEAFDTVITLLSQHHRRKLMRHAVDCPCLGADEATFAQFVTTAATGEREEALWMAMLLVRPDMAMHLTAAASAFGLRIAQMLASRIPPVLH